MPIVPSRSSEIQRLAQSLGQGRAADRESAIARLTLLGERALPTLLEVLRQGTSAARVDALAVVEQHDVPSARAAVHACTSHPDLPVARRAVEACVRYPDSRTVEVLRARTRSGPRSLRLAAVEALLALLEGGVVEAIDPLLELALAEQGDEEVRRAALPALDSLSPRERTPLLARLRNHRPASAVAPEVPDPVAALQDLGGPAAISALHRVLQSLPRADEPAARTRKVVDARGRAHRALATLGSRIALYDLRESLGVRPPPAPSDLLAAAAAVGDGSLVPALAALATEVPALEQACVAALGAIARREQLLRTSPAVRAVRPSDRPILDRLWPRRGDKTGAGGAAGRGGKRRIGLPKTR